MEKQEEKKNSSGEASEDVVGRQHPLCYGYPYGRVHEFCFPCWKYLLGQEGYH